MGRTDRLILIDSVTPVPEGYSAELTEVCGVLLERTAAKACGKMLAAALAEGVEIKALSGYRSKERQRELWNMSAAGYMSQGLTAAEAEILTGRYLARAGHSEHQTGLACDLCTPDAEDTQEDFAGTPQGKWLCRNAPRFGFILRYPRMKEHITGINYEPWHYRYVGTPHSKLIAARGITLEEYLYYK